MMRDESKPHSEHLEDLLGSARDVVSGDLSEGRLWLERAEAVLDLFEQYEDLHRVAGTAVGNAAAWEAENRGLKEQFEAYRAALEIIASRTHPATYLGVAQDGTKMYGGSDDASRFAREVLDRVSSPARES